MKSFLILFLFFYSYLSFSQEANIKQILKNYKCSEEFEEYVLPFVENNKNPKFVSVGYIAVEKTASILKHLYRKCFNTNEINSIFFSKDGRENTFILRTSTSSGYELIHFCTFKWVKDEKLWSLKSEILNEKITIKNGSWLIFKE